MLFLRKVLMLLVLMVLNRSSVTASRIAWSAPS